MKDDTITVDSKALDIIISKLEKVSELLHVGKIDWPDIWIYHDSGLSFSVKTDLFSLSLTIGFRGLFWKKAYLYRYAYCDSSKETALCEFNDFSPRFIIKDKNRLKQITDLIDKIDFMREFKHEAWALVYRQSEVERRLENYKNCFSEK